MEDQKPRWRAAQQTSLSAFRGLAKWKGEAGQGNTSEVEQVDEGEWSKNQAEGGRKTQ